MCEFCGNDKDIIFPFQLNKCQRCEGEPSLLVAGVCGSRDPSPRPYVLFTWRNWKIPKNRRLARDLSRDRREGEGGEEDLELDVDEGDKIGEQEERGIMKEELRVMAKERQERGRIFQAFITRKMVNPFSMSKGNKVEQEMTGGTESEGEEERRVDDRGEVDSKKRARSKERGDGHTNREKVSLLKVLQIDRLKKSISNADRLDSDSEIFSSMESLNEVGQERKGRRKGSGLLSLAKGFTKRERASEGKTEVKESEKRFLEKVVGTKEEGKARWEVEENNEQQDKSKMEAAETAKTQKNVQKNVQF